MQARRQRRVHPARTLTRLRSAVCLSISCICFFYCLSRIVADCGLLGDVLTSCGAEREYGRRLTGPYFQGFRYNAALYRLAGAAPQLVCTVHVQMRFRSMPFFLCQQKLLRMASCTGIFSRLFLSLISPMVVSFRALVA